MNRLAAPRRQGLTLLEVVLALAILAGSVATLAQLVGIGMRAAGHSRDLTQAQLLAESILSEIAAGIVAAEPINRVPVDTNPGWLVSTFVDNTIHPGMLRVTVLTERDSESYRRTQYQLSRWIRDPSLAVPTEEDASADSASSDSSSGSGGSSAGGDGSGGDGSGGGNNNGGNNNGGNNGGGGGNRGNGGGGGGGGGGGNNRGNAGGGNRGNTGRGGAPSGNNANRPGQSGGPRTGGGGP